MTDERESPANTEPLDDRPNDTSNESAPIAEGGRSIDAMLNVGLQVQIVLGRSRIPISQLLKLTRGSILELDKRVGDPVEVMVNDRLIARGDLVKIEGDRMGVSLKEIVKDYVSEV